MRFLLLLTALLAACDDASTSLEPPAEPAGVHFTASADLQPLVDLATADVPLGDAPDALQVRVVRDDRCAECYRIERDGAGYVIRGGGPLGIQYGVTELLEGLGFRFYHPFATRAPDALRTAGIPVDRDFAPEIPLRALHLHTLHPIEPTFAFWTPGDESFDEARRILDWTVRGRANAIQWVALEDILKDDDTYAAWKAHTRKLLDAAHARGLTVGLGIQLFGQSNLQRAFDLVDGDFDEADVRQRLRRITEDLPFDRYNLSFGEFVGADPQKFVDTLDRAYAILHELAPHAEVPATIHVGNYDNLRVEYRGQRLLYYFLVQFADPAIIPWIHSVMYYDLYEDAGGAYEHQRFDEHRAFLEDRVRRGAPVGYFPEDAYWVAFDDSVPTFLPLYVRSRHLDLARLREVGKLPAHVLFSSGWEWGYWLNDYAALRMGYTLPAKWTDLLESAFAPYDADVAGAVAALADVEHDALVDHRLAPYLAGRDTIIDAGDQAGVIAAPDRLQPTEAAALRGDDARAFAADVIAPLAKFADDLRAAADRLKSLPVSGDPFVDELRDGAEVTALRAAFVSAIYRAATGTPDALDEADALLDQARTVVARRHAHLHAPHPERFTKRVHNPTLYQFGYLFWADSLCYWQRERVEVARLLGRTGAVIPACAF